MAAGAGVTEFYLAPRSSSASHASCMIALALVSLSPFCLPRHRSTAARKSSWHRSTTCVPGPVVFGRPGLRRGTREYWTFRNEKPARALAVQLEDGRAVTVQVFIYEGRNLIDDSKPLADKARMVVKAAGIRGSDFDYVRDTYEGLKGVGVDDPAVTDPTSDIGGSILL
jgi:hypothetical protein